MIKCWTWLNWFESQVSETLLSKQLRAWSDDCGRLWLGRKSCAGLKRRPLEESERTMARHLGWPPPAPLLPTCPKALDLNPEVERLKTRSGLPEQLREVQTWAWWLWVQVTEHRADRREHRRAVSSRAAVAKAWQGGQRGSPWVTNSGACGQCSWPWGSPEELGRDGRKLN